MQVSIKSLLVKPPVAADLLAGTLAFLGQLAGRGAGDLQANGDFLQRDRDVNGLGHGGTFLRKEGDVPLGASATIGPLLALPVKHGFRATRPPVAV
jgi:hypothetical protein